VSGALGGIDCPDGLARCVDGVVEVSRLAEVPARCSGKGCACPWDALAKCPRGCAAPGVEVLAHGVPTRVCAAAADQGLARPAGAPAVGTCGEPGLTTCAGAVVVVCEAAGPRAVGVCARGCIEDGEALEDLRDDAARVALLCRRE